MGAFSLADICQTSILIRTCISNYIHVKQWNVITDYYALTLMKLGHGWVITSHIKACV